MDCIFCKIIKGDIPSYKVYEDENVVAFLDISQITKGHTLIVPKKHVKNVYEMDESLASKVFVAVPKIANAIKKTYNPIGLNVINNNEKPHQSVDHFHIHLIPRYSDDNFKINFINRQEQFNPEDYENIRNKIKRNI
ncbi:MAG: HIT family protein [Candidatus Izimaplasma sp.]|nr:HIT family protein [Candidatus Izimaplasma bacterium]